MGEITLHVAQTVNTEQLQHCVQYKHCFRYTIVNIMHKGENKYDDDDDNNNNNNNNNKTNKNQCNFNIGLFFYFKAFFLSISVSIIRNSKQIEKVLFLCSLPAWFKATANGRVSTKFPTCVIDSFCFG